MSVGLAQEGTSGRGRREPGPSRGTKTNRYSIYVSALAPTDSQHHDPATFMARTHQQQSFLPRDGAWHQLVKPRVLGCLA